MLPDKKIQNIKDILEKEHGREFTWEEATKAMRDIENLARIAFNIATEELKRQERLKEFPKGFHLNNGGPCLICGNRTSEENSWFDKYGLKCMVCQKAINAKIIPSSIAKNEESWYSTSDLGSYFNIRGADLNRYVKQSILKSRIILGEGKKVHLQLFLMKDNIGVLPPKKLLQSRIVKIMHKGEEYQTQEYWYEFIDHKLFKRLEKYKIMECLKETFAKPIQEGHLLCKTVNPIFSSTST